MLLRQSAAARPWSASATILPCPSDYDSRVDLTAQALDEVNEKTSRCPSSASYKFYNIIIEGGPADRYKIWHDRIVIKADAPIAAEWVDSPLTLHICCTRSAHAIGPRTGVVVLPTRLVFEKLELGPRVYATMATSMLTRVILDSDHTHPIVLQEYASLYFVVDVNYAYATSPVIEQLNLTLGNGATCALRSNITMPTHLIGQEVVRVKNLTLKVRENARVEDLHVESLLVATIWPGSTTKLRGSYDNQKLDDCRLHHPSGWLGASEFRFTDPRTGAILVVPCNCEQMDAYGNVPPCPFQRNLRRIPRVSTVLNGVARRPASQVVEDDSVARRRRPVDLQSGMRIERPVPAANPLPSRGLAARTTSATYEAPFMFGGLQSRAMFRMSMVVDGEERPARSLEDLLSSNPRMGARPAAVPPRPQPRPQPAQPTYAPRVECKVTTRNPQHATRNECSVCMDRCVNTMLVECEHPILCQPCAVRLNIEAMQNGQSTRCPLCKTIIRNIIALHFPTPETEELTGAFNSARVVVALKGSTTTTTTTTTATTTPPLRGDEDRTSDDEFIEQYNRESAPVVTLSDDEDAEGSNEPHGTAEEIVMDDDNEALVATSAATNTTQQPPTSSVSSSSSSSSSSFSASSSTPATARSALALYNTLLPTSEAHAERMLELAVQQSLEN